MPFALGAAFDPLASYQADVRQRGGAFISYLPDNTNLGATVKGFPGARFLIGERSQIWTYELAPFDVVAFSQPWNVLLYPFDKSGAAGSTLTQMRDLGHQVQGATKQGISLAVDTAAGALGLSSPVFLVGLAGLAFVLLRPQLAAVRRR